MTKQAGVPGAEEPARPPALGQTPRVRIIAPSGPITSDRDRKAFTAGRRRLEVALGCKCSESANLGDEQGYLAGDDDARLAALHEAFAEPEIDALVVARGGYGITRLLSRLDPTRLRRSPKIIVGFSDVTALLAWTLRRVGLTSVHGPNVTQLATVRDEDLTRLVDLLRGVDPGAICAGEGAVLRGGRVTGRLVTGNIEVLRSLIGTPHMPDLRGCILALEEVGERPYRIDRALTQLITSGSLRGVRGVAVGQLIACRDPEDHPIQGPPAHDVVVERLATLGVPVVTGFAFGHDRTAHAALPFGAMVELDADHCSLYLLEPVVE